MAYKKYPTSKQLERDLNTNRLENIYLFLGEEEGEKEKIIKKIIDKKILESLSETIINNFLVKYKHVLENFKGEISLFKSFSNQIMEILESKYKDYKKALYIDQ